MAVGEERDTFHVRSSTICLSAHERSVHFFIELIRIIIYRAVFDIIRMIPSLTVFADYISNRTENERRIEKAIRFVKKKKKKEETSDQRGSVRSASRILIIDRGAKFFFFLFARFKSQPALISRALRRDKFTRRTCYHSRGTLTAFIHRRWQTREGCQRARAGIRGIRGRMSMKGGDFSISYSPLSPRYKCK